MVGCILQIKIGHVQRTLASWFEGTVGFQGCFLKRALEAPVDGVARGR